MEDLSLSMVRRALPAEWVIHDYKPDYGIDLVVEVFDYVDNERKVAETLGDLFFVQVKSVLATSVQTLTASARTNVEIGPPRQDKTDVTEMDVVKFRAEVPMLTTVQAMGSGLPVLLFLVSLDLGKVFFVCLNDLIDKVIIPEDAGFQDRHSKSINIPVTNEINTSRGQAALRFYARRTKFYAAFQKFEYQYNQLQYAVEDYEIRSEIDKGIYPDELTQLLNHFLDIIMRLYIWSSAETWGIIPQYYREALALQEAVQNLDRQSHQADVRMLVHHALDFWCRLAALSHIYEDVCREWFLPTYIGAVLSI